MRSTGKASFGALVAALAVAAMAATGSAHDGHDHGGARHGGAEAKTKRHHFEAVIAATGVTLYVHGPEGKTLDAARLAATATFYHPNVPNKPWFSRELKPSAAKAGSPANSLSLAADLASVPASGARIAFRVTGLSDPAEPEANFSVPFAISRPTELTVAKATAADGKVIAAMKLCPVSNEDLGSMGGALKVSRGEKSTFICCKGCLKQIQANPEKYLGTSAKAPAAAANHEHHDH